MRRQTRSQDKPSALPHKRPRYYADHDFPQELADYLANDASRKVNIQTAHALGYSKRDDDFHFHYAARDGRILLTRDRDYLDDQRFPLNETAGVIIFSGVTSQNPLGVARMLFELQRIFRFVPADTWVGTKIVISEGGFTVRQRTWRGRVAEHRYADRRNRYVWCGRCPRCRKDAEIEVGDKMLCPSCGEVFDLDET